MQAIRKNLTTLLIVLATVVLAGVAIYTAIRLYQTRQGAIAPTAPTSKPAAATLAPSAAAACQTLAFSLTAPIFITNTNSHGNSNSFSNSNCNT